MQQQHLPTHAAYSSKHLVQLRKMFCMPCKKERERERVGGGDKKKGERERETLLFGLWHAMHAQIPSLFGHWQTGGILQNFRVTQMGYSPYMPSQGYIESVQIPHCAAARRCVCVYFCVCAHVHINKIIWFYILECKTNSVHCC